MPLAIVRTLLVLALLGAAPVPAVAATAHGAAGPRITVTRAFSPNGDGVKDEALVRFRLTTAATVRVRVLDAGGATVVTRRLGRLTAGLQTWTWNGRDTAGERARDGEYAVVLSAAGRDSAPAPVLVDRRLRARDTHVALGDLPSSRPDSVTLFPRSAAIHDVLVARPVLFESRLRRGSVTITDPSGDVVLRRRLPRSGTSFIAPELPWDGRDRRTGRPLPAGTYTLRVKATDLAGNRGSARPLDVVLSPERLVWIEETRRVVPRDVGHTSVCGTWSGANGCPDAVPCGPLLPSALFAGGLSHQSAPCTDYRAGLPPRAESASWFPVTEAVRGLGAMRVAFEGAPTVAGEGDTGTLTVFGAGGAPPVRVSSGSGAATGWVAEPSGGLGSAPDEHGTPRMPPSALWFFETTGTDSFDVASYTVDLRYLGVAR